MAKKEKFTELTTSEQIQKRDELTKKLREYRFTAVMGKVENVMEKRNMRRAIARLNTLIHQKRNG
jgi:large subunit ribosomal protein L29